MSWYYSLWADAIGFEKAKHGHFRNWKPYVLLGISFSQGLNLAAVLLLVSNWIKNPFFLTIDLFPGTMLDGALSGIITLFLPFVLLNYLLVLKNKKYELIIEKFPYRKGKLYIGYFITSVALFFLPVLIGFLISRM